MENRLPPRAPIGVILVLVAGITTIVVEYLYTGMGSRSGVIGWVIVVVYWTAAAILFKTTEESFHLDKPSYIPMFGLIAFILHIPILVAAAFEVFIFFISTPTKGDIVDGAMVEIGFSFAYLVIYWIGYPNFVQKIIRDARLYVEA